MRGAVAFVVLCACGRIGFDRPPGDGAPGADASTDSIPPGARIWLRMDKDPNAGIVDSAGGHTVTCTTTCPGLVTGHRGMGFQFIPDEQLIVTYASDLDASNGFSAALWLFLVTDPSATVVPYGKSFNSANGWDMFVFGVTSAGQSYFDGESTTGVTSSQPGQVIALNGWHHLAMTWDGSNRNDYQDGVLVASVPIVTGTSTDDITVGGVTGYYYAGSIDDVVYYTRVLTAQEVAQLATP